MILAIPIFSTIVQSQGVVYPDGCVSATFPDPQECLLKGWDLGPDAFDPCAPLGPYPVSGQQVYIQDPHHFCIALPDPSSPILQQLYYNQNKYPTVVSAEGYVRAFCVGNYMSPGALPLNVAGLKSAHVLKGTKNGKSYLQVSGMLDCTVLGVDCSSVENSGQYDSVEFRKCGKEPYSGVDRSKNPNFVDYIEQAGNNIFCMRVCEAGLELEDPCNVKNDTLGCFGTMGVTFPEGYSFTDENGVTTTWGPPNSIGDPQPQPRIPIQSTVESASPTTTMAVSTSTVAEQTTATTTRVGSPSGPTVGSSSDSSAADKHTIPVASCLLLLFIRLFLC